MAKKDSVFIGVALIAVGGIILLGKIMPQWEYMSRSVSFISLGMMISGAALIASGFAEKETRFIPGFLLLGCGSIIFLQHLFRGHWGGHPWLLVPVFLGIGMFFRDVRSGIDSRRAWKNSSLFVYLGIILFILFSFRGFLTILLPAILIIFGIGLLLKKQPVR